MQGVTATQALARTGDRNYLVFKVSGHFPHVDECWRPFWFTATSDVR